MHDCNCTTATALYDCNCTMAAARHKTTVYNCNLLAVVNINRGGLTLWTNVCGNTQLTEIVSKKHCRTVLGAPYYITTSCIMSLWAIVYFLRCKYICPYFLTMPAAANSIIRPMSLHVSLCFRLLRLL